MVVILTKDPFVEAEATAFAGPTASQSNIRRPLYGITPKTPRHAFISVFQDGGKGNLIPVSVKDSSAPGGWSNSNHNFIVSKAQESRQEKVQIIETFGDHWSFFYGEKPIVYQVQGVLINTLDFNWKNEWSYNYERFLRGTKCVENRSRVFLGFDDILLQGFLLTSQVNYDDQMPYLCAFNFQMLLSKPPLDLSPAASDEISAAGSNEYVTQAEEARSFVVGGNPSGVLAEYLGPVTGLGTAGASGVTDFRYVINPLTGESEPDSSFSPLVPNAVDNPRTAFWVSEIDPKKRQWRTPDEALLELNTKLAAQQRSVDDVVARQSLRNNPSSFQLSSRDAAVEAISKSLTTGISNSATVIPPDLGSE